MNGCRIYYQLSTCNKLPQSAQMLNFLQIFCKSQNLSFTIVVHHQCVANKFQNIYNMTSRSSCSWLLSAFPADTPSFLLLNTSSHSVRCRFVHVSIFFAIFCSIILVALLVVSPCRCPYKQPYFDRMGSCKLLSSLLTEFPPAHVSFTQFFSIYIWYKFPIFYFKFSILYLCCSQWKSSF